MWQKIKEFFLRRKTTDQVENPQRVLLIDDDEVCQKIVQKSLTKRGYKVFLGATCEIGLDIAKREKPDLIILDCALPDGRGVQVGQRLRADKSTKHIPLLFLTGDNTPRSTIECFELGAQNYLTKPISGKELASQVKMAIEDPSTDGFE